MTYIGHGTSLELSLVGWEWLNWKCKVCYIVLPLGNLVVRKIPYSFWIVTTIEHVSTFSEQSSQYVMTFFFGYNIGHKRMHFRRTGILIYTLGTDGGLNTCHTGSGTSLKKITSGTSIEYGLSLPILSFLQDFYKKYTYYFQFVWGYSFLKDIQTISFHLSSHRSTWK